MSKYKVGDKVVIRKDLIDCKYYGNWFWSKGKEHLKEKDYVVINEVDNDGDYWIEDDWCISNEMIDGLYEEEKEMGVKAGDKVRVIKDVKYCNTINKGGIVEIDRIRGDIFYVKDHKFNDMESQLFLFESEFELVKENKKYIWYLDSEDGTYFLNNILVVEKWCSHETEEIKNGKDICYLLTEEEAKQSPFFDKFKKHDPSEEKWYYIRMKGNIVDCLNLNTDNGKYLMDNKWEVDSYKSKFTEKECEKIIGTSSILYKEEFQND